MAARAVASFRAQTYPNKRLFALDTGSVPSGIALRAGVYGLSEARAHEGRTIGILRNHALMHASACYVDAQIFIHWDDDDYSHPNRIAEQVALLQSSGADAVGYRDMLFWDSRKYVAKREAHEFETPFNHGTAVEGLVNEAWIFHNDRPGYALGTSLCYWRKTWERKPFTDRPKPGEWHGEDTAFIQGLNVESVSSMRKVTGTRFPPCEPRMIASIHGGNSAAYDPKQSHSWQRAPEWDAYCRERMKL
jgi:glycosyltransferase involved in cell wall biosynthesis